MGRAVFDPGLPAIDLARDLLGRLLVRIDGDGRRRAGVIVETEAYPGGDDLGSHSRGGRRTPGNSAMYLAGGHLYVYLIYGLHHCVNLVSGPVGAGEAVLIRAIRPTEGLEAMRRFRAGRPDRDLARGPGRLCAAMSIDRSFDGLRVDLSSLVRIEPGESVDVITTAPRVGLANAGAWSTRPWRFLHGDPRWWSSPRPRKPS
jgi:DNA-3-methyladenine glycosylase